MRARKLRIYAAKCNVPVPFMPRTTFTSFRFLAVRSLTGRQDDRSAFASRPVQQSYTSTRNLGTALALALGTSTSKGSPSRIPRFSASLVPCRLSSAELRPTARSSTIYAVVAFNCIIVRCCYTVDCGGDSKTLRILFRSLSLVGRVLRNTRTNCRPLVAYIATELHSPRGQFLSRQFPRPRVGRGPEKGVQTSGCVSTRFFRLHRTSQALPSIRTTNNRKKSRMHGIIS